MSSPELEPQLRERIAAAAAAWPGIDVPADELVRYVEQRTGGTEALDSVRGVDLYLACACARGDERAVAAFREAFRVDIARAARRLPLQGLSSDDALQLVLEKLLVAAAGEAPRVADYDGRGTLRNWVRVAALRTLIDQARQRRPLQAEILADDLDERAPGADAELEILKRKYRDDFRAAFAEAVTTLSARERNLLRHAFVEQLGIDEIAAIYNVHRATAARWVTKARDTIATRTRRALRERLAIDKDELDSILRLVDSQVEISLSRILR